MGMTSPTHLAKQSNWLSWLKRLGPFLIGGALILALVSWKGNLLGSSASSISRIAAPPVSDLGSADISISVFNNDSLGDYELYGQAYSAADLDTFLTPQYEVAITSHNYFGCIQVLFDSLLYLQRWDTLSQLQFWREIMTLSKDSALISRGSDRRVLARIPSVQWDRMEEGEQFRYRDSLSRSFDPPENIYVTAGKSHYYQFQRVLPTIGKALEVFRAEGVDPWYAQAILLIESPGAMHRSPVGAYGSFQLMAEVGREQGLVVSDSIDEREDFVKAAAAAARHIQSRCVRPVRNYLKSYGLSFSEGDLWFRLLVLHAYHAGPGNVAAVLHKIDPQAGGIPLMQQVWQTEAAGFKNASQNYSQLALASMVQVDIIMANLPDSICHETPILYEDPDAEVKLASQQPKQTPSSEVSPASSQELAPLGTEQ